MRSCLICDDHELMRGAIAAVVSSRWPDVDVQEARDYPQAWAGAATHPDLCLMDLVMPGGDPMEGVSRLIEISPQTRVIIVTGSHDDAMLLELLARGVHGFLEKTVGADVILAAIDLVLAGSRYLPPRVAELALNPPASRNVVAGRSPTDRQRQVLMLIAQGHSNKEIARSLGVSPATVKTHVAHAIASIGAINRTEAVMRARELGLI